MKKFIWLILILISIGAIIVVGIKSGSDKAIAVTVGKVEKGDITSLVTATGKIHPEIEVSISSEVSGEIIDLPVSEGQSVSKGDRLVQVNPNTLEAQVKQQAAALLSTKANAAQSKAELLQAELDLRRLERLLEKGYATQEQIDDGRTVQQVKSAALDSATARIEQQEMQLKEASDTLAKATLFAPIDGTITALTSELGDRVVGTGQFAGTEILRIANLKHMEVRIDVSEADIVSVFIGAEASVEIDAIADTQFEGIVTEIANSATTSGGGAQDQLTTFQVKVKLVNPSDEIRPGMTATADIRTKTVTNVIKVPLQSVTVRTRDIVNEQLGEKEPQKDQGTNKAMSETKGNPEASGKPAAGGKKRSRDSLQRVVFRIENGIAKMTKVETGIADNRSIEIISGLKAGDEIVTGSYRVLTRELAHDKAVKAEEKGAAKKGYGKKD